MVDGLVLAEITSRRVHTKFVVVLKQIISHQLRKFTDVKADTIFRTKKILARQGLTLKGPIRTAADDNFCDIFPNFFNKIRYDIS